MFLRCAESVGADARPGVVAADEMQKYSDTVIIQNPCEAMCGLGEGCVLIVFKKYFYQEKRIILMVYFLYGYVGCCYIY